MAEDLPKAVWEGVFMLGQVEMKCTVLDDGRRIIDATSVEKLLCGASVLPTDEQIEAFSKFMKGADIG